MKIPPYFCKKKCMERFKSGNIFKLHGNLHIVYHVDSELTFWVDFSHSNSSGSTPNITKPSKELCWDCSTNDSDMPDYECLKCNGSGTYDSERIGMDRAVFIASNVKEYILSRLTKNFDF